MNLEDVKKFLAENKEDEEVKAYINSFKGGEEPTLEVFKELIETDDDFKSFMDSQKDKHYGKALETWKENNLQGLVEQKVAELYPEDDPKDIEMQKLKREMEELKNERMRERMTNLALKKATELNLPTDLVDYFVTTDEENTLANIEKFHNVYTEDFQSKLREKLRGQGDNVPGDGELGNLGNPFSADSLNLTEQGRLLREDPEKAETLKRQAQNKKTGEI